jgi:hypothetical protein
VSAASAAFLSWQTARSAADAARSANETAAELLRLEAFRKHDAMLAALCVGFEVGTDQTLWSILRNSAQRDFRLRGRIERPAGDGFPVPGLDLIRSRQDLRVHLGSSPSAAPARLDLWIDPAEWECCADPDDGGGDSHWFLSLRCPENPW